MLRLRPYRKNDAQEIIKWCKDEESFYKWSAGIMGEYPLTEDRFENATNGRIDNDKYFPFVLVDENNVVGFFSLRQPGDSNDELRFGFVIVSPEIRGKGYGKKMLELGKKFAFELYGAKKLGLGVFDNNPGAYHCYKSVGFIENGKVEKYNINNEDWTCIEMELK